PRPAPVPHVPEVGSRGSEAPTFVGPRCDPRSIPGTACPLHRGAMTKAPRTTAALDVRGLTKRYGSRVAVDDLTFSCTPGSVTGFLGPNGAGKSTTLRILTGLAEADAGQALVGSRPYRELDHPARTIGVMLDATALPRGRTGLETLRLTGRAIGMPAARAGEVLELVGLRDAGAKRVGG